MLLRAILIMSAFLMLSGCSSMKPSDFSSHQPEFVLESYFAGKTQAWGIFEDRFGKVKRQFVVDIEGDWNGEELVLDERFRFDDGERSTRQWRIRKMGDGRYEGTADDVVGKATGIASGNALNWSYVLDLKVGDDSTLHVRFDDWMFLQPGGVLLNRARMSKFGINLGQVTIAFQKLEHAELDALATTFSQHDDAEGVAAVQ
jgi:hypothetical protein